MTKPVTGSAAQMLQTLVKNITIAAAAAGKEQTVKSSGKKRFSRE
ncbi:hypothetical protein ACFSM5_17405 [Lacibacterium aquatile]|uniref:Uncharacterized protein n=1 Tax=Lacibacterium aquatile TaxID=1168082 RepID=A0ABW5DW41_9PROT